MALSVTPLLGIGSAGAAETPPPPADPIADGAFCDGAPETNPFTDLGAESAPTREAILCLVATGLTSGTTATTYTPGGDVTRRQMAVFIKRLADLMIAQDNPDDEVTLTPLPAYDGTSEFSDIGADESDEAEQAIGQLSQAGIVGGFSDGTYRPNENVSRRQMAAFINRLQDHLTGSPYAATGDYFDDDNGDSGEDNLNALASVGIFQGSAPGVVDPGGNLSRRQMANILLRDAQVHFEFGTITSPFSEEPEPTTNQDFTVEPADDVTAEWDDTRQFTVTGLDDAATYDIELFECANVMADENDIYTFAGLASPNADDADPGTLTGAGLTVVNGVASTSGDDVSPTGGTITFTLEGTDTECVVPVVFDDTDDDDTLNLDTATGEPTDAFGVGGTTQFLPPEADGGAQAAGTVTLVGGSEYAALDDTDTVFFNAGDTYRILNPAGTFFIEMTAAEFFANLSVDDTLFTCTGNLGLPAPYAPAAANEYCLNDEAPLAPTALTAAAGDPADTAIDLSWTASGTASTEAYTVYSNDELCADTDEAELTEVLVVPATETDAELTGLTPDTDYCFVVTATEGTDESDLEVGSAAGGNDNTVEASTVGEIDAPIITAAELTTDVVPTGATTIGDIWTLTLDESMDPATVTGATIAITDADGDTILVECGLAPAPADNLTSATCALGDGVDATVTDDTLVINLLEAGEDRNVGGGNDAIEYDLTITAITLLADDDDGALVDIAGSTDVTID